MPSTQKDLENIKQKIIEQINSKYSKEKAEELSNKIKSMKNEEFVSFLKQQGLLKENDESKETKCIFCAIVSKEIPSIKLAENEDAIAILEINPISEGHAIIIPKKHIKSEREISKKTKELAEFISNQIQTRLNPRKVEILSSNIMGHEILNILPIYKEENLNSERKKKTLEELEKLKQTLEKEVIKEKPVKKEKLEETSKKINEKNTWLPKRIP